MSDHLSELFKGIALFTPGGDLIYCLDTNKQEHWHVHLCLGLQSILDLPEPPHFLVPSYTATIDRWWNQHQHIIETTAEIYPAVSRYQGLLNAIFNTKGLCWQLASWQDTSCDPMLIETYREQFPQLWEDHDLVVNLDVKKASYGGESVVKSGLNLKDPNSTLILLLFIAGNNARTEKTLTIIHQLLEEDLGRPYTLKVIDILQHPDQAEINQVSAIPTLIRVFPEPIRRIVGELDNPQRLLHLLSS